MSEESLRPWWEAHPDDAEFFGPAKDERPRRIGPRRQRKLRARPSEGLRTPDEVAARLGCSIKTLNAHVASGAIRYVILGQGRKRPRRMFTDTDINEFIADQTRKDSPVCPSFATRVHPIGALTSRSEVIAFSARPRSQPSAKRKR